MRTLDGHKVNGVNDGLEIVVMDAPGAGGACHQYDMRYTDRDGSDCRQHIRFQNGPILEKGVNGTTHEALLAIVIDRLKSFQSGPYKCDDNWDALDCLETAMDCLKARTRRRQAAGIEGTMKLDSEAPAPVAGAEAVDPKPAEESKPAEVASKSEPEAAKAEETRAESAEGAEKAAEDPVKVVDPNI